MGAGSWNGWRKVNPDVRPDLHKADLRAARLWEFDLTGKPISINLTGANLSETDLSGTQLSEANLSEADRYAHLDADPLRRASDRIGSHIAAAMGDMKPSGEGAMVVPLRDGKSAG
jgi:hypothetical protein